MHNPQLKLTEALLKAVHQLQENPSYVLLECPYNGGGDDGTVQQPKIFSKGGNEVTLPKDQQRELFLAVIDIVNKLPDWWTNDGGGGLLKIDLRTGRLDITHSVNESHTEKPELIELVDAKPPAEVDYSSDLPIPIDLGALRKNLQDKGFTALSCSFDWSEPHDAVVNQIMLHPADSAGNPDLRVGLYKYPRLRSQAAKLLLPLLQDMDDEIIGGAEAYGQLHIDLTSGKGFFKVTPVIRQQKEYPYQGTCGGANLQGHDSLRTTQTAPTLSTDLDLA